MAPPDGNGAPEKIILEEKFGSFAEHWRPKVVARLNGQEIKVIKAQGEFPWHHHEAEDEFFLVCKGCFIVEFRDRAEEQAEILCFEPAGVRNTGNLEDEIFTAPSGVEI